MSRRALIATAFVYQTAHDLASRPQIAELLESERAAAREIIAVELDSYEEYIYNNLREESVSAGGKRRHVTSDSMRYGVHVMLDTLAGAFNLRAKACRWNGKVEGLNKDALRVMDMYISHLSRMTQNALYQTRDHGGDKGAPLFYNDTMIIAASMHARDALMAGRLRSEGRKKRNMPHLAPRLDVGLPVQMNSGLRIVK